LQFPDQLSDLEPGDLVRLAAERGCAVEAPKRPSRAFDLGLQVPATFQTVQHGVKRAGTERVAVASEFVNHPLAIEGHLGGMV